MQYLAAPPSIQPRRFAGTIQLNHVPERSDISHGHEKTRNGKPPENTLFAMSLKAEGADDVGFSAFSLMIGLSALNSGLSTA